MQCLYKIVLVILPGLLDRFADVRVCGKMHACFYSMFVQNRLEKFTFTDLTVIERDTFSDSFPMPVNEIIDYDHFLSLLVQVFNGDTADITCPAGYQDCHDSIVEDLISGRKTQVIG